MGNKLLDVATTTGGGSDLVTFFLLLRREDERGNNGSCNAVLSFLTTIEEDDDGARVVTVAEVENEGAKVGHEVKWCCLTFYDATDHLHSFDIWLPWFPLQRVHRDQFIG